MLVPSNLFQMQHLLSLLSPFSPPTATPHAAAPPARLVLFGADQPWNTSALSWIPVTDQVRGGSSTATLAPRDPSAPSGPALFAGTLDTSTLGGAGFASVATKPAPEAPESSPDAAGTLEWDLAAYDGIELVLGASNDSKRYALTLTDQLPRSQRPDGRERAAISWEAEFGGSASGEGRADGHGRDAVWLPWSAFKPTYRGREVDGEGPLHTEHLRRFGLMMRSFFDQQRGEFGLEVREIAARTAKGTAP